jgi:hypothetical protein
VSGVVCSLAGSEVSLVPATALDGVLYSALAVPQAGDTLWALADSDTTDRWLASEILSVRTSAGRCGARGIMPFAPPDGTAPASVVLSLANDISALGAAVGSPIRVTRLARYSLYHASDGAWYLGYRDAAAGGGFDVIQPVSGPYASRSALRFRYRSSTGVLLAAPVDSTRDIAAVEVAIVADVRAALRRPNVAIAESLSIVVGLRNAR